ncbi:MAG: cyclase family protein [Bdellovibrionales bacterium]|nr:cyclase family protein [Bdellovibrionales bacterium]
MKIVEIEHAKFDLSRPVDISIPLSFGKSVTAFGVGQPQRTHFEAGGFVGDVSKGGSCNCDQITLIPHCQTTHTECVSHILHDGPYIHETIAPYFGLAELVSVDSNGVTKDKLSKVVRSKNISALIIRSLPNADTKKSFQYQGHSNFMSVDAIEFCNDLGVEHLLVDFPSIDPMEDGGKLLAHRTFWNVPSGTNSKQSDIWFHKSVTELVYVSNEVPDGVYLLNLQVAAMELDAAPARPILYPKVVI